MTQSTRVDLGLRERSQPGEAQRPRAECPPAFLLSCVTEDGVCPFYSDGRCAQVEEKVTPR